MSPDADTQIESRFLRDIDASIRPSMQWTALVRSRVRHIEDILRTHDIRHTAPLKTVYVFGSLAKKTALYPLADVDIFVEYRRRRISQLPNASQFTSKVVDSSDGLLTRDDPALCIEYPTPPNFDVVIGAVTKDGLYMADGGEWKECDCLGYTADFARADRACGGKLSSTVRLVKFWALAFPLQNHSYLLEKTIFDAFPRSPIKLDDALCIAFRNIGIHARSFLPPAVAKSMVPSAIAMSGIGQRASRMRSRLPIYADKLWGTGYERAQMRYAQLES